MRCKQCSTAGCSAGIPCLSLWERCPSKARTERVNKLLKKRRFSHLAALGFAGLHSLSPQTLRLRKKRHAFICRRQRHTAFPLSVASSDSSPRGRAKGMYPKSRVQKTTLINRIFAILGGNQRGTAHGSSLAVQGWRFLGGGESAIPAS